QALRHQRSRYPPVRRAGLARYLLRLLLPGRPLCHVQASALDEHQASVGRLPRRPRRHDALDEVVLPHPNGLLVPTDLCSQHRAASKRLRRHVYPPYRHLLASHSILHHVLHTYRQHRPHYHGLCRYLAVPVQ
ncbi:hypothetical protein EV182_008913, partial [Spiromyces aspiralis]